MLPWPKRQRFNKLLNKRVKNKSKIYPICLKQFQIWIASYKEKFNVYGNKEIDHNKISTVKKQMSWKFGFLLGEKLMTNCEQRQVNNE